MRNKWNRALALVMAVLTVFGVAAFPVQTSAKVKLNKKKMTLFVGKSFRLKISGSRKKVSWSSNRKAVASVSSKGVVKRGDNGEGCEEKVYLPGYGKRGSPAEKGGHSCTRRYTSTECAVQYEYRVK